MKEWLVERAHQFEVSETEAGMEYRYIHVPDVPPPMLLSDPDNAPQLVPIPVPDVYSSSDLFVAMLIGSLIGGGLTWWLW